MRYDRRRYDRIYPVLFYGHSQIRITAKQWGKRMINEKVYEYIRSIPAGKVVTYSQIAAALGNRGLARAVGNALHKNPDADKIPCYRVVDARGRLSANYAFGGIEGQRTRLKSEGIEVVDYRVALDKYQYRDTPGAASRK